MKKLLILTYCLLIFLHVSAERTSMESGAETFYENGEYLKAAEIYKQDVLAHPASAITWFNLGNSYYKSGKIGYAVAAYRKAYKLDPTDEDIEFNLQFVFNQTVDKIEPAPKNIIVRLTDIMADLFTASTWAVFCLVCGCLGLVIFVLYIFTKKYNIRRFGLLLSVIFWGVSFVCLSMAAHRYYYGLESCAVIVSPSAEVLTEPNEMGTNLLQLNEGATLKFESKMGEWVEIELTDGTVGYIKSSSVEIL